MADQKDIFDGLPVENKKAYLDRMREKYPHRYDMNPMVQLYGYGPEGKFCRDCAHHVVKKMYHKCEKRKNTGGPGTDIRVNYRACGKFEGSIIPQPGPGKTCPSCGKRHGPGGCQ